MYVLQVKTSVNILVPQRYILIANYISVFSTQNPEKNNEVRMASNMNFNVDDPSFSFIYYIFKNIICLFTFILVIFGKLVCGK